MVCSQLFVEREDPEALDVLARRPRAFTDESERIGSVFASHAAAAVAQAQEVTDLDTAVASRDLIGQVTGVLVERYEVTADQASPCSRESARTPTASSTTSPSTSPTGVIATEDQRRAATTEPPPSSRRDHQSRA